MNTKVLALIPAAALVFFAPAKAHAYVGFGINLAVPLYYPSSGYYYPNGGYPRTAVYEAPTRTVGEQVTVAPGPGYVWIAGHWSNSAQRWFWIGGRWELPPSPSAIWVAGHWVQANGGWIWANDTWSVGSSPAQPGVSAGANAQALPPVPTPPAGPAAAAPSSPPSAVDDLAEGTTVSEEPPPPIIEAVPLAPYPDYVWVGGSWGWRGSWYWNAGHYAPRPFHGAIWVGGSWGRTDRGWAWHGGRWH